VAFDHELLPAVRQGRSTPGSPPPRVAHHHHALLTTVPVSMPTWSSISPFLWIVTPCPTAANWPIHTPATIMASRFVFAWRP
jgi:hypothetical protein